jgi:amino acid adenylation domain-containing protein/FkbM family methyltransferase
MYSEPNTALSEHPILNSIERQRILVDFNNTKIAYAAEKCIHNLFEEQVECSPNAMAVALGDQRLSYRALNARANQLANHLQALGVGPEALVAICVERSLEMVVGILGILKAGGAYVPLDPVYPKERLAFMLEDAKPSVLLTQEHLVGKLPKHAAQLVSLDGDWSAISQRSEKNLRTRTTAEHLAYVIYTSGSTGKPKGVMITHGNLGHYVQAVRVPMGITVHDRYLHTASISFSSSVRQLMVPLSQGATVVIATSDQIKDPVALFEIVRRDDVTIIDIVPSYWRNCVHVFSSIQPESRNTLLDNKVRLILSASEPLLSDVPRDWTYRLKHKAQLINMLGQTETTGIVSTYPIPAENNDRVKVVQVGHPIGNTQIYLLDSRLQPVPMGVPGDIHIGGPGVGRGYLNHPELTAQKFIPDPFSSEPGARLYKTGDLGRYLPDGNIEFLGRIDNQVKIRGHRVELGEVETVLRQHLGVRDAAVIVREDEPGNHRLVAYAVQERACAPSIAGRERYRLPNNMAIVQQNKHETDFFYQQIFIDQTNFRHGITLRDGDCVVDVGANIGLFALFLQQVWKDITIYAFEPIPAIFETLSANMALYGAHTKLFQCGLADDSKEVEFTYYPNSSTQSGRYANTQEDREVLRTIIANQKNGSGSNWGRLIDELVEERIKGVPVVCQLRTLSEIIREHKIERIDLLKIDAEKSELDVLAGIAESDWEKIRQVVIEADGLGEKLERLNALLEQHGFTVVAEEDDYIKGSGLYNVYATRKLGDELSRTQKLDKKLFPIPVFPETILTPSELRQYLQVKLPEYMVPSAFVILDALPLTPNGKVDRRALPIPAAERPDLEGSFAAPRAPLEEALVAIWSEVLGVRRVGVHDNFFELGGDSLKAVQMIAKAKKAGLQLATNHIFQHQTIAELAAVGVIGARKEADPVGCTGAGRDPSGSNENGQAQRDAATTTGPVTRRWPASDSWSSLVALQPHGSKPPLFWIHGENSNAFLPRHLGPEQPLYGVLHQSRDGKRARYTRVEDIAAHYLTEIRSVQPRGPYFLGGFCIGGTLAFEMAQQLHRQDQKVALLILLDATTPGSFRVSPDSPGPLRNFTPFREEVDRHVRNLALVEPRVKPTYVLQQVKRGVQGMGEKVSEIAKRGAYKVCLGIGYPLPPTLQYLYRADLYLKAEQKYEAQRYRGPVIVFETEGRSRDPRLVWGRLAGGGLEVIEVPGKHTEIVFKEAQIESLAKQLKKCLDQAQAKATATHSASCVEL